MFSSARSTSRRATLRRRARHARLAESLEPRLPLTTVSDANWQYQDGGMQDLNTGLVWSKSFLFEDPVTYSTYSDALGRANDLVQGGFSDWRLATEAELKEAASHGILNHAYADLGGRKAGSWSTTKAGNKHVYVSLFDGASSVPGDSTVYHDSVAVRGARAPVAYSTPGIRVFSQQLFIKESPNPDPNVNPNVDGRFTVALDTAPSANVTIPVSSSDVSQGTVSIGVLTFTPANWNVPQGVLVTEIDDALYNPDHQFTVVLGSAASVDPAYNSLDPADVNVTIRDDESALILNHTLAQRNVSEDGNTSSGVRLGARPSTAGDVYVVATSLDLTEGIVTSGTLVFNQSNWDIPQTVAVKGVADGTFDGDQRFNIKVEVAAGSLPEFLAGTPSATRLFTCLDIDGVRVEYSNVTDFAIPDPGTVVSTIVVPAGAGTVGDVNVSLDINHTYDDDLTAVLVGPGGQRLTLIYRNGGSGDNFTGTTFDEEASQLVIGKSAPFTGRFVPFGFYLFRFDGTDAGGTWSLEVTDAVRRDRGTLLNWSLELFLPAVPLVAASAPATLSQQSLSSTELAPIVAEAFRRWQAAGASTTALASINVQIADLPGNLLGLASGRTVWLDRNAAGWGWFVDPTPASDSEFTLPGNQGEQNRMDLLTTVMHELGHVLGYDHDAEGAMQATLAAGMRHAEADLDLAHQAVGAAMSAEEQWALAWLFDQTRTETRTSWSKR